MYSGILGIDTVVPIRQVFPVVFVQKKDSREQEICMGMVGSGGASRPCILPREKKGLHEGAWREGASRPPRIAERKSAGPTRRDHPNPESGFSTQFGGFGLRDLEIRNPRAILRRLESLRPQMDRKVPKSKNFRPRVFGPCSRHCFPVQIHLQVD